MIRGDKLLGRTALVTGAGRGIGRSVALKLAVEGARVVVNDLDEEPAEAVVSEIRASGGEAVRCAGSVVDSGFPDRFVATAVEAYGGIDIVINNAGYTWDSVIQKMTDRQWDAIVAVHLTAPFRILRAVQPVIRAQAAAERDRGHVTHRKVVNISSISGVFGNAGQSNYAAAKAGVVGLTKTLAKEWGRYSVNVNAVAFGFIETRLTSATADGSAWIDVEGNKVAVGLNPELKRRLEETIPLGRAGMVDEAAGAVALLTFPEADYISGQTLIVGGGFEG